MKHCTVRAQYSTNVRRTCPRCFRSSKPGPPPAQLAECGETGPGPLGTWQCRKFHPSQPIHHIEGEVGYVLVQRICLSHKCNEEGGHVLYWNRLLFTEKGKKIIQSHISAHPKRTPGSSEGVKGAPSQWGSGTNVHACMEPPMDKPSTRD
jgi:hypothetical protein